MEVMSSELLSRHEMVNSDASCGQVRSCLTENRRSFETISVCHHSIKFIGFSKNVWLDTCAPEMGQKTP